MGSAFTLERHDDRDTWAMAFCEALEARQQCLLRGEDVGAAVRTLGVASEDAPSRREKVTTATPRHAIGSPIDGAGRRFDVEKRVVSGKSEPKLPVFEHRQRFIERAALFQAASVQHHRLDRQRIVNEERVRPMVLGPLRARVIDALDHDVVAIRDLDLAPTVRICDARRAVGECRDQRRHVRRIEGVVVVEEAYVLAACEAQAMVSRGSHAPVLWEPNLEDVPKLIELAEERVNGVAAIVDHDELDVLVGLREHALHGAS